MKSLEASPALVIGQCTIASRRHHADRHGSRATYHSAAVKLHVFPSSASVTLLSF